MGQVTLFGKDIGELPQAMTPINFKEREKSEQAGLKPQEGKFISKRKAEQIQMEKEDDLKYSKEYCFNMIEGELYLWDMRCWDKYKDRAEMMEWLSLIEQGKEVPYNCGHVHFLIERMLKKKQATKEEIIEAMLKNSNKQYARRLVKCFVVKCPNKERDCKECE